MHICHTKVLCDVSKFWDLSECESHEYADSSWRAPQPVGKVKILSGSSGQVQTAVKVGNRWKPDKLNYGYGFTRIQLFPTWQQMTLNIYFVLNKWESRWHIQYCSTYKLTQHKKTRGIVVPCRPYLIQNRSLQTIPPQGIHFKHVYSVSNHLIHRYLNISYCTCRRQILHLPEKVYILYMLLLWLAKVEHCSFFIIRLFREIHSLPGKVLVTDQYIHHWRLTALTSNPYNRNCSIGCGDCSNSSEHS